MDQNSTSFAIRSWTSRKTSSILRISIRPNPILQITAMTCLIQAGLSTGQRHRSVSKITRLLESFHPIRTVGTVSCLMVKRHLKRPTLRMSRPQKVLCSAMELEASLSTSLSIHRLSTTGSMSSYYSNSVYLTKSSSAKVSSSSAPISMKQMRRRHS